MPTPIRITATGNLAELTALDMHTLKTVTAEEVRHTLNLIATEYENNKGEPLQTEWIDPRVSQSERDQMLACFTGVGSCIASSTKPDEGIAIKLKNQKLRSSHAATEIHKLKKVDTVDEFKRIIKELGIGHLPVDDTVAPDAEGSFMGRSIQIGQLTCNDRRAAQPMEGTNAFTDGSPTFDTKLRWYDIGASGASLAWMEACSVAPDGDGRASWFQTQMTKQNQQGINELFEIIYKAREIHFGKESLDNFIVGPQLTYSGRNNIGQKRVMYHHPVYEDGFVAKPDDVKVFEDQELDKLIEHYVEAAKVAREAGAKFVDIKACHGYLLHESLSAFTREGKYGGKDLQSRSRLLRHIVRAVKKECPELEVGVRLSIFDTIPRRYLNKETGELTEDFKNKFMQNPEGYQYAFGVNPDNPLEIDLKESIQLIQRLKEEGVSIVNCSAGNPYQTDRAERPAYTDIFRIPEPYDPKIGVATLMEATRQIKINNPDMPLVSSGSSALEHFIPNVAEACIRQGWFDVFGTGKPALTDHFWAQRMGVYGSSKQLEARDAGIICENALLCVIAMKYNMQFQDRGQAIPSHCTPFDPRFRLLNDQIAKQLIQYRTAQKEIILEKSK